MSDYYLMKPEKNIGKFSYIYYERNKHQCPHCEYSTYNTPVKKGGNGWYDCSKKQQTRINHYCVKFKQKKEEDE